MDKYVVFKIEDFNDMVGRMGDPGLTLPHPLRVLMDKAVDDATVIRRQDMFASVPLHAYACAVNAAMTLLRKQHGGFSQREMDNLQKVFDYMVGEAEMAAQHIGSKVPD